MIAIINADELYRPICFACDERGEYTLATEERNGEALCASCATSHDEAAYERSLSDYYGGSGPQTINEQYNAAVEQRRELRKRD